MRKKTPRSLGLDRWMTARVPGTLHYHLQKLKKIPDPFNSRNELEVQWVDEQDWEMRKIIRLSQRDCDCSRRQLIFDGIDTVAEIHVNGHFLAHSRNMFRRVVCEAGKALRPGSNEVRILLKSPTAYARGQARLHRYRVQTDPDFKWETGETRETRRSWIRKVQCHFGWDWGIYLAVSGLWQSARLECSNAPRFDSLQVLQYHQGPPGKPNRVRLEITARLETAYSSRGNLRVKCGGREVRAAARLKPGENHVGMSLTLESPRLWWPNGQGEPYLYPLQAAWEDKGGESTQIEKRIGLRTLELVTQADRLAGGEKGESFYFKVNGRPVFMKGANWIPPDALVDRCTTRVYRHLLSSMAQAHMNMVRVWGGGWYEQDVFYDLCDELGLLVWQDFMMACAVYPDTRDFIQELTQEARYQVRRLSSHACLALWCGDNENLSGLRHWWESKFPGGKRYPGIYRKVMNALARTCRGEDPARRFWISSPSNGSYAGDPDDPNRGDVHYWKVWHGGKPFDDYLKVKPRFASEFGFQSFPETSTLARVVPPEEWNTSSWVMEHHQRSPKGNLLITHTLARELPLPKDFDSFCYSSQINQALAIRTAVEHWRRSKPRCMGTLYWQLNDLWPVASWSSIDYLGRWKVLHHEAQRFFAPLLASFEISDGKMNFWATSDLPRSLDLKGEVESLGWEGKVLARFPVHGRLKAGESRRLLTLPVPWLLKKGMHPREVIFFARLQDGNIGAENHAILVPWKWVPLPKPRLETTLRPGKAGWELTVQSSRVAPFFHAWLKGWEGHFTGDGQTLRPGKLYVFPWVPHFTEAKSRASLAEARKRLRTLSFYDLMDHSHLYSPQSRGF
jgi:beta-mannosidase